MIIDNDKLSANKFLYTHSLSCLFSFSPYHLGGIKGLGILITQFSQPCHKKRSFGQNFLGEMKNKGPGRFYLPVDVGIFLGIFQGHEVSSYKMAHTEGHLAWWEGRDYISVSCFPPILLKNGLDFSGFHSSSHLSGWDGPLLHLAWPPHHSGIMFFLKILGLTTFFRLEICERESFLPEIFNYRSVFLYFSTKMEPMHLAWPPHHSGLKFSHPKPSQIL